LIVFVVSTKVVEPMAEMTAQPIKPTRVPVRYLYIISFSFEHHALDCLRKVEVQTMFLTKPTTTTTIIAKNLKPNNVLINVVIVMMTCSQVLKQQVFRERESMKAKAITDCQIEEQLHDFFIHTIKELQGADLMSQAFVDLNRPLHSNYASLLILISQLVTSKQPIQLTSQTIIPEKTLEEILKDINTQVLEIKYVLNLGQFLKIVLDIKRYIFETGQICSTRPT